ncbi:DUF1653 domain-containing protein [Brevibacillus borstelensis]|uniref:DUF1653 domain-containing protein n=1 Tax=Brevibacillus borstelensis TaxID=45462 RepID=UPI0030FC8668
MKGYYQHYKGTVYLVHGIAKHTETEEDLVVYESTKTQLCFARPLEQFSGTVTHRGKIVPRFQKMPDPDPICIDEQEEVEFIQEYLLAFCPCGRRFFC